MADTYGGQYYPNGKVRIVFADVVNNTDLGPYSFIDLPTPGVRKLVWNKEVVEKESYVGEMKFKDRGFKPTLEIEFHAPSDTDIGKLIKVCNYKEPVMVFPFFDGTEGVAYNGYGFCLRMKLIEAEPIPHGGKNVRVIFKMKFKAMQFYSKIIDPDELINIIRGAYLSVTSPTGGAPGVTPIRVMVQTRRVTVGYFSQKIFSHQGVFN